MNSQPRSPQNDIKKKTDEAAAQILAAHYHEAPTHTLIKRLAERKIDMQTLMLFDMKPAGEGWTYTTPNGATRFKNANSNAANKYAWITEKRDSLFYAFDILEAIQQADSTVWIVTEFDVLAMRSAGIKNVIAPFTSETSLPAELPAMLQSWGVMVVYIAPDVDTTGKRWAQLVTDRLTPAGMDVIIRTLPAALGDKADIGKAWQQYTSPRSFERYLLDLPTHRLEVSPPEVINVTRELKHAVGEDIKQEIAAALGVYKFNGRGFSAKTIKCNFHDDQTASAGLHKDYGLHCFVCGWHTWKDLAAVLGINWPSEAREVKQPLARPMLADEVLQTMIREGFSVLGESLERMYKAGWIVGNLYNRSQLTLLLNSRKRASKAIQQMRGEGIDLRKHNARGMKGKRLNLPVDNFVPELTLFFFISKEGLIWVQKYPAEEQKEKKEEKKEKRGRPSEAFTLPEPEQIAAAFGVTPVNYSDIASRAKSNQWRAEVHAAPIDRQAGMYSRKQLVKPLGISTTTSRKYNKLAGVKETPNIERSVLPCDETLPEGYNEAQKLGYLETDDGKKFAATKSGYKRAENHGGRVWIVKRLANTYSRDKDKAQAVNEIEAEIIAAALGYGDFDYTSE